MDSASTKLAKEAFVTGHSGSTPWEVLLVCGAAPIGSACYQALAGRNGAGSKNKHNSILQSFLLEAMTLWLPMILCQSNYLYPFGILYMVCQLGIILWNRGMYTVTKTTTTTVSSSVAPKQLVFVTLYRSCILYLTFIAILAVDFHVFPRRFCKTEVSGYGLMDVGAASFCFSAGLVQKKSTKPTTTRVVWHTLPLVLLGGIRLATNKGLEYQEHVSEYGVHWNFFFTLSALGILVPLLSRGATWWIPISILCVYQVGLSVLGLQQYIESAPRHCTSDSKNPVCQFFAANREGILGCIGYLVIYLLGQVIGQTCLWNSNGSKVSLWTVAVVVAKAHIGLVWIVQLPTSRRSTNASFVTWVVAHNVLLLALLQRSLPSLNATLPTILQLVNQHGLLLFVIANLLTGLVNLTIPTLGVSDPMAICIVFLYICGVGLVAILLDTIASQRKKN